MKITEEQNKAAQSIVELIVKKIGNGKEINPATAISACARLAGSFMFRSFNLKIDNISPGSVVLSEVANEKGPVLINVLGGTLDNFGVTPDQEKMKSATNATSNLNFIDTLKRLQNPAQLIMNENNLNYEQMAYSCAMATAFIIKECQRDFEVESGFHTAVYGFIEGSKTSPPEFEADQPKKKSLFKFWK